MATTTTRPRTAASSRPARNGSSTSATISHEMQVWFLAEHLVDVPLADA